MSVEQEARDVDIKRVAETMFEKSRLRLLEAGHASPGTLPTWVRAPDMHSHWLAMARDATEIITAALRSSASRDEVLEEAAKVADETDSCGEQSDWGSGYDAAAQGIAAAIRGLKAP